MSLSRFGGKVAVVTGAANGIGAAVARRFATEGAMVAILDIDTDGAVALASELEQTGTKAVGLSCDVSSASQVGQCFDEIGATFGTVDILVNNAGTNRDNLVFRLNEEDWDAVLDTHLKGTFLCTKAAQAFMVEQRSGKIVCISSRSTLGNRGQANYSAAKAGIQGFVKTLSIELGPFGINVNSIAPGHVDTSMTRGVAERTGVSYEEIKQAAIDLNAIKRVGTPDDIAAATAFFASEESSYITGQVLYVTGRPVN